MSLIFEELQLDKYVLRINLFGSFCQGSESGPHVAHDQPTEFDSYVFC